MLAIPLLVLSLQLSMQMMAGKPLQWCSVSGSYKGAGLSAGSMWWASQMLRGRQRRAFHGFGLGVQGRVSLGAGGGREQRLGGGPRRG